MKYCHVYDICKNSFIWIWWYLSGAAGDEGGEAGACADPGHPESADTEDSTDVVSDDKPTFNSLLEDEKLYQCFLYALKKKVKKTQLPMLTSGFYRDCLQICV